MNNLKLFIYYRSCPVTSGTTVGRPTNFSKENCFRNLIDSENFENCTLRIFFDGDSSQIYSEEMYSYPIKYQTCGNDHKSYIELLNFISCQNHDKDDIIYILEDDYIHHNKWLSYVKDAYENLEFDFLTLYDHPDKYLTNTYSQLRSRIFLSSTSHWRTIPSTTNTFMFKYEVFTKHKSIFYKHWLDHEKFMKFNQIGLTLISPIPGYSTHCMLNLNSPFF